MTTSTENRIDEWIARVKHYGAMKAFAFLPGFPAHKTPNPVTKYTVAVVDSEQKVSRFFIGNRIGVAKYGRLYETELRLRVYAPEGSSGSALLRASALLMDALEHEDSGRMINCLSLSGIDFDTASRTEYRDVVVRLSIITEEAAA
ncbi:MAG: hypothetical protein IJH07_00955 [Ruminococcus sp.]|nr:hypothetical protein [Ruminococcus sp.]